MGKKLKKTFFRCEIERTALREGTFFIGGGGGEGAKEGRVTSKFFTSWGGSNLFYSQLGEDHIFFGKKKITPRHLIDSYLLTNSRRV